MTWKKLFVSFCIRYVRVKGGRKYSTCLRYLTLCFVMFALCIDHNEDEHVLVLRYVHTVANIFIVNITSVVLVIQY